MKENQDKYCKTNTINFCKRLFSYKLITIITIIIDLKHCKVYRVKYNEMYFADALSYSTPRSLRTWLDWFFAGWSMVALQG